MVSAPAISQCRRHQRQEVDVDVCRGQPPGYDDDELDRRGTHGDGAVPQQRRGDLASRLRQRTQVMTMCNRYICRARKSPI